jgi:hypothetical protein
MRAPKSAATAICVGAGEVLRATEVLVQFQAIGSLSSLVLGEMLDALLGAFHKHEEVVQGLAEQTMFPPVRGAQALLS